MTNFEQPKQTIDTDASPRMWTVQRTGGALESGWTESGRQIGPDGVVRVEVTKPAEDGSGEYAKTIPLDTLEATAAEEVQRSLGAEAVGRFSDTIDTPVADTPETESPPVRQEARVVDDEERIMQMRASQSIISSLKATFDALGQKTMTRSAASVIDKAMRSLEEARTEVRYARSDPYDINEKTLLRLELLKKQLDRQRSIVSHSMADYELEAEIKEGLRSLGRMHWDVIIKAQQARGFVTSGVDASAVR